MLNSMFMKEIKLKMKILDKTCLFLTIMYYLCRVLMI